MGEGDQRIERVEIALESAEISLQPPERGDYRCGHAIFSFGAAKNLGVLIHLLFAHLHPVGADRPLGKLEKSLAEDALRAVAREHLAVDRGAGERPVRHIGADALIDGLGFHALKKLREIAAAPGLLGKRRGGGCSQEEGCERGRESGHE